MTADEILAAVKRAASALRSFGGVEALRQLEELATRLEREGVSPEEADWKKEGTA